MFQRRTCQVNQGLLIQRALNAVVLSNLAIPSDLGTHLGLVQNIGVVQPLGFPVVYGFAGLDFIGPTNHVIHGPEAELGHILADFLSNELHEIHCVDRVAHEFLAQCRILGRDADRAGVEMADPHHNTA